MKALRPAKTANRNVADLMRTALLTITPDTFAASANRLARKHGEDYLVVLDGGSVTGIVARSDLDAAGKTDLVHECMQSPVYCVSPETSVDDAVDIMSEHGVGCLPVVADSYLVGLVTRGDLRRPDAGDAKSESGGKDTPLCAVCRQRPGEHIELRSGGARMCTACIEAMPFSRRGSVV